MEEKIKEMLKAMKKVSKIDCGGVDCDICPLLRKDGGCYRNDMFDSRREFKTKQKQEVI